MNQRFAITHKGWEITATSHKLAEGQHEPAVSIARHDGDASFEHTLSVPEFLMFESAGAAGNYALRLAMRYIDEHDA